MNNFQLNLRFCATIYPHKLMPVLQIRETKRFFRYQAIDAILHPVSISELFLFGFLKRLTYFVINPLNPTYAQF